jgi:hypothetical protein
MNEITNHSLLEQWGQAPLNDKHPTPSQKRSLTNE